MNEARTAKMKQLLAEGKSYAEIGRIVGLSRQRVFQLIGGTVRMPKSRALYEYCVYPNLKRWLVENKVGVTRFTIMTYGDANPTLFSRLRLCLSGSNCRKYIIDRILSVTGMTYEEAFAREEQK